MNAVEEGKLLVQTYQETGSIAKTASLWHTSRQVVRKWVRRAAQGGEVALQDRSRRATRSPRHADLKDILDKGALGKPLWDHLRKHRLPRYQWTVCESRSRLRLLAYSHEKTQTNGITFLADWVEEFGGEDPEHIHALEERFLRPLDGALCRYPKGRKQYNGRVERSHRADDEEFYRPYLLQIQDTAQMLRLAARWVYFSNVVRPPCLPPRGW